MVKNKTPNPWTLSAATSSDDLSELLPHLQGRRGLASVTTEALESLEVQAHSHIHSQSSSSDSGSLGSEQGKTGKSEGVCGWASHRLLCGKKKSRKPQLMANSLQSSGNKSLEGLVPTLLTSACQPLAAVQASLKLCFVVLIVKIYLEKYGKTASGLGYFSFLDWKIYTVPFQLCSCHYISYIKYTFRNLSFSLFRLKLGNRYLPFLSFHVQVLFGFT